jgi:hypothetical protein
MDGLKRGWGEGVESGGLRGNEAHVPESPKITDVTPIFTRSRS